MIESRYKIEYVLPDEDVKKTSPFRVLWYLLLISLVMLVVTGITYDFSYKNISKDALELVEKAKVHVFNLGELRETNKKELTNNAANTSKVVTKINSSTTSKVTKDVSQNPVIKATSSPDTKPKINPDKVKITELTTQQELQLKTIQTQVEQNSELSQNLNQISEKLVLEQLKTQELNSQLAQQEIDRKELEEQLNKALENAVDNEITLEELKAEEIKVIEPIKETVTASVKAPIENSVKTIIPKVIEKAVEIELPQEDIPEAPPLVVEEAKEEAEVAKTETDKIIEAMENLASEKDKTTEVTIETAIDKDTNTNQDPNTVKTEVIAKEEVVETTKVITQKEVAIKKLDSKKIEPVEITNQTPEPILVKQETAMIEEAEKATIEPVKVTEINKEVVVTDKKESQIEAKVEPEKQAESQTQPLVERSAVDDIIAAMEASQPTPTNANQKIDLELEKEIKQQLVEKGDLSVDN